MNQLSKEEKSFTEWLPEAVEESKDILQELRLLNIYKSLGVDNLKDAQSKIEQLVAEKQGLISLEDAFEFQKWVKENATQRYRQMVWECKSDGKDYNFHEIFQIYKQQTK